MHVKMSDEMDCPGGVAQTGNHAANTFAYKPNTPVNMHARAYSIHLMNESLNQRPVWERMSLGVLADPPKERKL